MSVLLTLARHGETDDNARAIFQGQQGRGLNRLGRAQAARLGERLRRAPPFAIVASDLERAVETARIVAEACGVAVETDPDLREVDIGTWSGRAYADVQRDFPDEWAAWQQGIDGRRGGGETYAELSLRVDAAIERIVTRHGRSAWEARRSVLIVSHGGAIKSWIARVLGISTGVALGNLANTGLVVVERPLLAGPSEARRGPAAGHRVRVWNDSAHLDDLAPSLEQERGT